MLLTRGTTWFELANTGKGTFPGTDELEILPGLTGANDGPRAVH